MRCFLIIFDLVIAACFILGALLTRVLLPSAKNMHRHLGIFHAWRVTICISPVDWRHRNRYCCWLGTFSKMWILKQYLWFLHAWQRTGVGKMYTASPTDRQTLWATDMIGCFSQEGFLASCISLHASCLLIAREAGYASPVSLAWGWKVTNMIVWPHKRQSASLWSTPLDACVILPCLFGELSTVY